MGRPEPGASSRRATLDRDEFAALYGAAAGLLWTVAVAVVRDRGRAEDVLQEACVIALERLVQFRPGTSFEAWMARIVRNVALNRARAAARQGAASSDELEREWEAPPAPGRAPVDPLGALEADQDAFDDRVAAALAELAPVARACLLLKVVEGHDYHHIAAVLDLPEGTAMSHVHRARAFLRERLAGPQEETA